MDDQQRTSLQGDARLRRAVALALASAEADDGTVGWPDLRGEITAMQWGRLLRTELLVPAGDRFVVEDPTSVREAVAVDAWRPDADASDEGATGWQTRDKVAGLGALALMASYQAPAARRTVAGLVDPLLGPLEAALPFALTVALLAMVTALGSRTIQRRLGATSERERLQARLSSVRERLERARERGDDAMVEHLEAERQAVMGDQLGQLGLLLRPMAWTVLLTAPVFLWLSWLAVAPGAAITPTATVFPLLGRIVWTARVLGPVQAWMVWYVGWSLVTGVLGTRALDRLRPNAV